VSPAWDGLCEKQIVDEAANRQAPYARAVRSAKHDDIAVFRTLTDRVFALRDRRLHKGRSGGRTASCTARR